MNLVPSRGFFSKKLCCISFTTYSKWINALHTLYAYVHLCNICIIRVSFLNIDQDKNIFILLEDRELFFFIGFYFSHILWKPFREKKRKEVEGKSSSSSSSSRDKEKKQRCLQGRRRTLDIHEGRVNKFHWDCSMKTRSILPTFILYHSCLVNTPFTIYRLTSRAQKPGEVFISVQKMSALYFSTLENGTRTVFIFLSFSVAFFDIPYPT